MASPEPPAPPPPSEAPTNLPNSNLAPLGSNSWWFSKLFLLYWIPFLRKGSAKPLEEEDLPPLPSSWTFDPINARFQSVLHADASKHKGKPSLIRTIWKIHKWGILGTGVLRLLSDALTFAPPLLVEALLSNWNSETSTQTLLILVVAFFPVNLMRSTVEANLMVISQRIGLQVHAGLVGSIYNHSLNMSNNSRSAVGQGRLFTLLSVDPQSVEEVFMYLHFSWTSIIVIVFAIILLAERVGGALWIGILVMFLSIPAQGFLSYGQAVNTNKGLKAADKRVNYITQVLSGIRVIKFYAWEDNFSALINKARGDEVKAFKKAAIYQGLIGAVIMFLPTLITISTIIAYAAENDLDAPTVFATIGLLEILRLPLTLLPLFIAGIISAIISLRRASEVLEKPSVPDRTNAPPPTPEYAISIENGTFYWVAPEEAAAKAAEEAAKKAKAHKKSKGTGSKADGDSVTTTPTPQAPSGPTLSGINHKFRKHQLHLVVGPVGAGKSSLLSAILGELHRDSEARVGANGSFAYASQTPWIINTTVKNNITFGNAYDEERFNAVIEACALADDLQTLAAGVETEIGERGINLSGGQKARVALARALYSPSEIIIMDGSLAAVDAHVGAHLITNALNGPLAEGRTRILATNQIQFLSLADTVTIMKNGTIDKTGSYQELVDSGHDFATLQTSSSTTSLAGSPANAAKSPEETAEGAGDPDAPDRDDGTEEPKANASIMTAEERERGAVSWSIVKSWLQRLGPNFCGVSLLAFAGLLIFYILDEGLNLGGLLWISLFTGEFVDISVNDFILVLAILGVAGFFTKSCLSIAMASGGVNASTRLHSELATNVLRLPTSFFDSTPTGRILNRFSKDTNELDTIIFMLVDQSISFTIGTILSIVVASVIIPAFALVSPILAIVFWIIGGYHRRATRELKRLEAIGRSPVFANFSEVLAGVNTIRAYQVETTFKNRNSRRMNYYLSSKWTLALASIWIGFALVNLSAILQVSLGLFAIWVGPANISSSILGLAITVLLGISTYLAYWMEILVQAEAGMNSVERIKYFAGLPTEAAAITDIRPPQAWPDQGKITFEGVQLRYRDDLPLVLSGLNATVQPGEKIGVVGRTGAGKSSLMTALFRLVELAGGSITIDGVDVSKIGLKDLRSNLGIVTQEAFLFSDTVRKNLDPFDSHTDAELWSALEQVQLKDTISGLEGGLSAPVEADGDNFSAGQRQLLSMARVILRNAKILILDEATSAVDYVTDAAIQSTIRTAFKHCTVLTIAHRLNTIMDSDRILVLDAGKVVEFDTPDALLAIPSGAFASLVDAQASSPSSPASPSL